MNSLHTEEPPLATVDVEDQSNQLNTDISRRVANLRERVLNIKPTVCTERARVYTDIYAENEHEPVIIKRAIALQETLRRMTIFIDEGELIVGNHSSKLRAAPIFPEYAVSWLTEELDEFNKRPGDAFYPTDQHKKEIVEICDYWKGKTLVEKGYALMPEFMKEVHESGIIRAEGNLTSGDGHIAVNYPKVLQLGIQGYVDLTRSKRALLDIVNREDLNKAQFYQAIEIGLEGAGNFIGRFELLARALSENEADPQRADELKKISHVCGHIKQFPPRNFYEALQLCYFIQLILQIESNGHSVSFGRMDQYLYPYYKKDIDNKAITPDIAMELLENTWVKLYAITKIRSWSHTRYSAGGPLYQNVTIAGQTIDGEDAVNELSYLILESVGKIHLIQPNLTVRYHRGLSDDFMQKCLAVIETGIGMPAFENDEIVIPSMLELGVEKDDAYNYSAIGCVEVAVPGMWGYRCTGMSFLNFMRVFLAALNDGRDVFSNKTFCRGRGRIEDFTSFEDIMAAWQRQIEFYAKATVAIDTAIDTALEQHAPDVICSALVNDCIERGKTIKEGGAKYDFVSGLQVGIANLGNSLAAIKKLVFEEERISIEELARNLENDFSGTRGEHIRQMLLNAAPKFGNDDDYVDELLSEAYMCFIRELEKYHNTRYGRGPIGGKYYAGTSSISSNVPSGATVTATPDGRKAYTALAEGCSPSAGTDRCGPTAVFKSMSKLPSAKITGGILLNQKLLPSAIASDGDKAKLISLIRTFFNDLKGWHVQYNIVSRETLLNAQKNPEEYRDLIVRVAGYSAFFTVLSPETQNDIIARTEQEI